MVEEKHPVEESKSWELYQERIRHRSLKKKVKAHGDKTKKNDGIPEPDSHTFHAMMIDAGSQGYVVRKCVSTCFFISRFLILLIVCSYRGIQSTRIHVYEFERRILYNKDEVDMALNGLKLSTPTTNSRWTNRLESVPSHDFCP